MVRTSNMTDSISLRFRHQQFNALKAYIENLPPDKIQALTEMDRGRRLHTIFKRQGRPADPVQVIVRLALDEWLDKHQVGGNN